MTWSLMMQIGYVDKLHFTNNFIIFIKNNLYKIYRKLPYVSGGAELLFNNQKKFDVTLPSNDKPWTIQNLLKWIKDNLLKERPEFFIQGDSVRECCSNVTQPC
ncbi:ubiquitin-related modifier 1 isoform X5 [Tachypleus tridentatus]|uniref:ubiquitin-related modifier 1 isoform X5 n=1 Tax=Tachypleus tridentatus TaxID=6853 RepID=UPI003FD12697